MEQCSACMGCQVQIGILICPGENCQLRLLYFGAFKHQLFCVRYGACRAPRKRGLIWFIHAMKLSSGVASVVMWIAWLRLFGQALRKAKKLGSHLATLPPPPPARGGFCNFFWSVAWLAGWSRAARWAFWPFIVLRGCYLLLLKMPDGNWERKLQK